MSLPVTEDLITRTAAHLRDGGWRFTLRQLYYASCSAAETPPSNAGANGEISLGVLLLLVGMILIPFRPAFVVLGGLGVVCILLGLAHRLGRRPLPGRILPLSYAEFERRCGRLHLPGLVEPEPPPLPDASERRVVLVCDTVETAAAVAANAGVGGLTGAVAVAAQSVPDRAPWRNLAALHDASPRGCALPLELNGDGRAVLDCGLRPRDVGGDAQVLEGAPARLPRDLSPLLAEDELHWLRSGRRLELATLRPAQLLEMVRSAVSAPRH